MDKGQCIVFVEQLGEKRLVPYESLTPLPPEQFKPWTVPYRLQRHMQKYSSVRFTRQYNYRFKFNATTEHHHHEEFACGSTLGSESCSNNYIEDDDPKKLVRQQQNQHCTAAASYFKLKQYTHLEDFRTHVEYCTMPVTVAHSAPEVEPSKGAHNQPRPMESNGENSRTPSRSSTSMGTHRHGMELEQNRSNNLDDPMVAPHTYDGPQMDGYEVDQYNANGAVYVPEMQAFYPMYHPYATASGLPEDYYGYCGYESVMPTSGTIMPPPPANSGYYYLCNNALAAPANYINATHSYILPPPLPQSIAITQPSPMLATTHTANASYYTPSHYNSASHTVQSNPPSLAASSSCVSTTSVSNTPSRVPSRSAANTPTKTPVSGRINYEAKKSIKSNGNDLPHDMATLRYFYNMGLDYFQKQKVTTAEGKYEIKFLIPT